MRFCDYCGDELETGRAEHVAVGHSTRRDYLRSCGADEWFYYCEGECIEAVRLMLGNMAKWANRGEDSGLRWQLVEAPGARTRTPDAGQPTRSKGTVNFDGAELTGNAEGALRCAGIRTLEDVAKRSEFEMLQIKGMGPKMIANLVGAMEPKGLSLRPGPDLKEVGARIRQRRESMGLGRHEVADAIAPKDSHGRCKDGIYAETVGRWERGAVFPTPEQLQALARLFGVQVVEFTEVAESAT